MDRPFNYCLTMGKGNHSRAGREEKMNEAQILQRAKELVSERPVALTRFCARWASRMPEIAEGLRKFVADDKVDFYEWYLAGFLAEDEEGNRSRRTKKDLASLRAEALLSLRKLGYAATAREVSEEMTIWAFRPGEERDKVAGRALDYLVKRGEVICNVGKALHHVSIRDGLFGGETSAYHKVKKYTVS